MLNFAGVPDLPMPKARTDAVITPSRKENTVAEVLCVDVNK